MNAPTQVDRQVESILGETADSEVDVIIQMESDRPRLSQLAKAAGTALSRRRMSLTSRDLLPEAYQKSVTRQVRQETASTRTLLGKATLEALTLAKIQKMGLNPMEPLLQSGLVRAALARMTEPSKKSARAGPSPKPFWTSRSMPLRLKRDELSKLPKEVENIKSVHMNRHLKVPAMMEIKPLQVEREEILASTWGLKKIGALAVWGAFGALGKGVTIGLLDTGVDASHPDLDGKVAHWAEFDSLGHPVASDPHDSDEHGTHCAGTLVGTNGSGRLIGVAPEAKLAAALVLDGKEGGTDAQVLAGIDWAVEQEVDVISLSLGGW